jgi:hypothetical protein
MQITQKTKWLWMMAAFGIAGSASAQTVVVPPGIKAPASAVDTSKRGFKINMHQLSGGRPGPGDANMIPAVEQQLSGADGANIIDATYVGPDPANIFLPVGDPNLPFAYIETGAINYSQEATGGGSGNAGFFTPDNPIPGVNTGVGSTSTDNIALEALGYLDLAPGTYTFAVNSDDGFLATMGVGASPKDLFQSTQLGLFNAGRGVSETQFTFSVSEAGYYPLRLVYWEGGGGASVEFYEVRNGTRILINDPNDPTAIKSYRVADPFYLASVSPGINASGVLVRPKIVANFVGASTFDTATVSMKLNGTTVTPTINKNGSTATVSYQPTTDLAPSSTNQVTLTWTPPGGTARTESWSFVTGPVVQIAPGSDVAEADVDKTQPGFKIFISQVTGVDETGTPVTLENTTARAESQIRGTLIDPSTTQPYVNNITEPNLVETGYINWNESPLSSGDPGADIGNFQTSGTPSRPDVAIPGVNSDPTDDPSDDNIAAEITAVLQLPAGVTTFGVNSDDGFRVTAGRNPAAADAQQLGVFEGGRGSSDTLFQVSAATAGFYPVRLIWYEGNGGANLEFFTVTTSGEKILVNDTANPNAIKAYQEANIQKLPIVDQVSPNGGFAPKTTTINISLRDQDTTVDQSSIVFKFNGATVSPTKTVTGPVTALSYDPPGDLAVGSTNTFSVTFKDSGGISQTFNYTFIVGGEITRRVFNDIGGGTAVSDLLSNEKYVNNTPDLVDTRASYETPVNVANNYGVEFLGYLVPSTTDDYIFYFSSDDGGQLWLSTDDNPANAVSIATQASWSGSRAWTSGNNPDTRKSAPIHLEAGKKYFTRAVMKEGGGGDNLAVAWRTASNPGIVDGDAPITGPELRPFDTIVVTKQPQSLTLNQGLPATFGFNYLSAQGNATFQWLKNGSPIGGEVGSTYTIPAVAVSDSGSKYSVKITDSTGSVTSDQATLTVNADSAAPTVVSASPYSFTDIDVVFNEPVPDSALQPGSFTLSTGQTVVGVVRLSDSSVRLQISPVLSEGQNVTVTADVSDYAGNAAHLTSTFPVALETGWSRQEIFLNLTGGTVADLTGTTNYPSWPNITTFRTRFEGVVDTYDNYGSKMVTWFTPPTSGNYVFYMSSDDQGELWLSTDETEAAAQLIASEPQWNGFREWAKGSNQPAEGDPRGEPPSNVSAPQALTAGKKYFIMTLHKEGGGGDNVGATYRLENEPAPTNGQPSRLTGNVVGTFAPLITRSITILTNPVSVTTATNGGTATFNVSASINPTNATLVYQWQVALPGGQFTDILNATGPSYTTGSLTNSVDDGKKFRVVLKTLGGVTQTSQEATLSFGGTTPQPQITVTKSAGSIHITWTNGGTLQSSPAIGAAANWQDVNSTGDYTTTTTGAHIFFRVVK